MLFIGCSGTCSDRQCCCSAVRSCRVDLKYFACADISGSSLIRRVCYDPGNEYMLISLNGTFYHYCGIDADTVSSLLNAPSMGRFYNASVKGYFILIAEPELNCDQSD